MIKWIIKVDVFSQMKNISVLTNYLKDNGLDT